MYDSDNFKQNIGISDYANMNCDTLGLDSPEHCFDKKHFARYESVYYSFNNLGYRHDNQKGYRGDEILAIGDSFTLGLGVNQSQTWPEQLSRMLNYPVLNFSMNGASNDWIARKTTLLLKYFQPRCVIVHYSFTHRRESEHEDWTDAERTLCEPIYTDQQNLENWQNNQNKLIKICHNTKLIHTAIANWHPESIPDVLVPVQVDRARDGFHYGPKTNQQFATSLLDVL
jgi:hypothetical protein